MSESHKLDDLYSQLHRAQQLDFIRSLEILVEEPSLYTKKPYDYLRPHNPNLPLPKNTKRLYINFSPNVSLDTIRKVRKYIELKYSVQCSVCEWSMPTSLDIYLQ